MNIALLECDHVDERFRRFAGDYRDMFGALLAPHGIRLTPFDAGQAQLPSSPEAFDGFLCGGSRASVYSPLEWIDRLKGFVREVHQARRPLVGICFGHQLIAAALGGKVARAPGGWGVGVHGMAIERAEPWMKPTLEVARMQYMHGDQVLALPEGAVTLARSAHCEVAMFRAGTLLGIEGHPEFPAAYNEALIRDRHGRIGPERADAALAAIGGPTDAAVVAGWIASFLGEPHE